MIPQKERQKMRMKSYLIETTPMSWSRAGHNGRYFYDKQRHEKTVYGLWINKCHGDEPMFTGPLELDVTFFMPIPLLNKNRYETIYHHIVPDLDNCCKFLMDAINNLDGKVWHDDKQVSVLKAKKIYDKVPRVEFTITELQPMDGKKKRIIPVERD